LGDIAADVHALRTWNHSPALYVFPDWLIAGAVELLPVRNALLPLAYASLLAVGYSFAAGALAGALGSSRFAGTLQCAAVLSVIMVVSLETPPFGLLRSMLVQGFAPYIHTGAALCTIAGFALVASLWDTGGRPPARIALAAIVLLTTFSDILFVAWFVVPALVLIAFDAALRRSKARLSLALVIGLPAVAGFLIERKLNFAGADYMQASEMTVRQSAASLLESVGKQLRSDDPIFLFVGLATVAILARGAWVFTKVLRRRAIDRPAMVELILAVSVLALIAAPIVTRKFSQPAHWRYLMLLPFLAVAWIGVVVARRVPPVARHSLAGLGIAASLAGAAPGALAFAPRLGDPAPLVACLDAEGLRAGIGDYWTAKQTMFLSDRRLHFVQLTPDGQIMRFNFNDAWFSGRADDGTPFTANFIVTTRLDQDALRRDYGDPARVITCAGQQVWLYDHPLEFAVKFAPALRAHSPRPDTIAGADLPGETGNVAGLSRVADASAKPGWLTFGPYAELLSGDYVVRLEFRSDQPGNRWQVVTDGARVELATGVLPDTDGALQTIEVPMHLGEDGAHALEVRSWFAGRGTLEVATLSIARLAPRRE